jgi:hypothetical protein
VTIYGLLARVPLTNEAALGVNNVLKTRGIDFTAAYDFGLGFVGLADSKLSLSSNVTYLMDYKFNGTEFAGFASADFGTLPQWKANTRLTYSDDALTLSLNWQYIGESTDTFGEISFDRTDPNASALVKAQNYFDLNARFKVGESSNSSAVYRICSINNLLRSTRASPQQTPTKRFTTHWADAFLQEQKSASELKLIMEMKRVRNFLDPFYWLSIVAIDV